jgi:SAM-dependent methyltransferase
VHSPPAPLLPVRELDRCPLCDGTRLTAEPFSYRYRDTDFPGARCRDCGFVFLRRQPAGEAFAAMYAAEYFDSDYHCGHEERPYFALETEQTTAAETILRWIEHEIPAGRLLEVGCAGGYFLAAARARGWSPIGVEVSDAAAAFARERLGLDVVTGTLDQASFTPGAFDAVYMGDSLEHVPRPMETLRRVHALLRPGGVFTIAGPITVNSLDRRIGLAAYRALGRTKRLQQAPYHLSEFDPRTLAGALGRAGFRVRWSRQSKIPPSSGNPRRRPALEHWAKFALDLPNWGLTAVTGRLGDRIVVLASR